MTEKQQKFQEAVELTQNGGECILMAGERTYPCKIEQINFDTTGEHVRMRFTILEQEEDE